MFWSYFGIHAALHGLTVLEQTDEAQTWAGQHNPIVNLKVDSDLNFSDCWLTFWSCASHLFLVITYLRFFVVVGT